MVLFYNKSRKKIPENMTFRKFVKSQRDCNNLRIHGIRCICLQLLYKI